MSKRYSIRHDKPTKAILAKELVGRSHPLSTSSQDILDLIVDTIPPKELLSALRGETDFMKLACKATGVEYDSKLWLN